MRDRLAAETKEENEARLEQIRVRVAAETKEENEARLQQMRVRVAAETPEERGQAARKDSRSVRTFVRKVNSVFRRRYSG